MRIIVVSGQRPKIAVIISQQHGTAFLIHYEYRVLQAIYCNAGQPSAIRCDNGAELRSVVALSRLAVPEM